MARPIFYNEVLGQYNGDNLPKYNIDHSSGTLSNAILTLINPIQQAGTPQNADNMNNMFNFDNLASMRNNTYNAIFNHDGSITETIEDSSLNIINAQRITSFTTNSIVETTSVYDDTGNIILRVSTITSTINPDGSITEVIT